MKKRIITALSFIPILIGAIIYPDPWLFQLLVFICLGIGLHEYFTHLWPDLSARRRLLSLSLGLFYAALWMTIAEVRPEEALPLVMASAASLVLFSLLFFVLRPKPIAQVHHHLGHLVFGILYIVGLGIHVGLLRSLPDGVFWVFAVLAGTWANDTAAYFVGRSCGRHLLAPHLSPKKTWEGWFGGIVGSTVGLFFFWWLLPNTLSVGHVIVLICIASFFGPLGDLSESMIKRSIGIKDSGQLIPGHGGMLDRIDAVLFNGPLFYYFALSLHNGSWSGL